MVDENTQRNPLASVQRGAADRLCSYYLLCADRRELGAIGDQEMPPGILSGALGANDGQDAGTMLQ